MENYIAVRAHGLKSRLLTRNDYEQIVNGDKDVGAFKDYLLIGEKDTLEEKLEKIYRVYVSRISLLAKASQEYSPFIYALLDRLEIENIKIQLRHILGYARPVIYYPYGRHVGPAKISNLKTESSIWEALRESYLLTTDVPNFTTGLVAERESFLDFQYYAYLMKQLDAVRIDKEEKSELKEAIKSEASLHLAYWIRVLKPQTVENLAKYSGLDAKPAEITLKEESTTAFLKTIHETIMRKIITRIETRHFTTLPFVYAYNFYAKLEAQNLEKILLGKTIGLPGEIIIRNLIFLE
jgi:vacuolar-type H+-ATPase subunit C/Vma6